MNSFIKCEQPTPHPKITIFDTTLRDGEQSPGYAMTMQEKVTMARQLVKLGVDVIEAGFPVASHYDRSSVAAVAASVKGVTVAALARAVEADIQGAADAINAAERKRIHTFIATSPLHMREKIRMTPDQVLERIGDSVRFARQLTDDVQWSAEDATNTDPEFLLRCVDRAIQAGATTINLPDTVGYMDSDEYGDMFCHVMNNVPDIDSVTLSAHCHNDRGHAVANTMAAIRVGVRQVECTINGIGERAGNAALEEIVMGMVSRPDRYSYKTNIVTEYITETARILEDITGISVQPNKPITGSNAFAHASGIHQHGQMNNEGMYEIIRPELVGAVSSLVIQRHSGMAALRDILSKAGVPTMDDETMTDIQRQVLEYCITHKIAPFHEVTRIAKGYLLDL